MNSSNHTWSWSSSRPTVEATAGGTSAARLLTVVDAGIAATICVAPFVFGGRHDLGRLVFVALVGVTGIAWFARQCVLPEAWAPRTKAYWFMVLAAALVACQLVPLPSEWLAYLSPRTHELLPLWTSPESGSQLGSWSTLSLVPRETKLALALVVSYGLFTAVLIQRVCSTADVERLLNCVAASAVLMATFGLVQFFASNGKYFWFYLHPYRTTDACAVGSFMNRNHFASFLMLGVGPLVRLLVSVLRGQQEARHRRRRIPETADLLKPGLLLVALAIVLMAIMLSYSRGGALALAAAIVTTAACYLNWRLIDAKYLYGLVAVGLVMLGLLSLYGYDQVADRLDDLAGNSLESVDHDGGRRRVWAANLAAIEQGGPFGAGAGSHLEICPVYLSTPTSKEYTHAENGYLQIVTENGWLGGLLLAAGLGFVAAACATAVRAVDNPAEQLCVGAAVAGLVASLVHSAVDFVWFIPACMSLTLVLAVCVLRLVQLSQPTTPMSRTIRTVPRARCVECEVLAALLAVWSIGVYVGPAVAEVHWDRYLRDAVAGGRIVDDSLPRHRPATSSELAAREPLEESMERHLRDTLRWDPTFARAHLRLAARYLQRFERRQQAGENAMTSRQIRDAVFATRFASDVELQGWLERAIGPNAKLLKAALHHGRRAAELGPLEGDAYVYLAELGFLEGDRAEMAAACVEQAQCVRPYDGDVSFEAGKQALAQGDPERAMQLWSRCYQVNGDHQLRIVGLLGGRIPAHIFLESLQPDWHTLRAIWSSYKASGQCEDLDALVAYAAQLTQREAAQSGQFRPAYRWFWLAEMYQDLERPVESLDALRHAYESDPHIYQVRYLLGQLLKEQGKYFEAEPHLRWCLARRPDDRWLSNALVEIAKLRLTQQETDVARSSQTVTQW